MLEFKRAFWIIAIFIFVFQMYSFSLGVAYGFGEEGFSVSYWIFLELGGVVWYLILMAIVISDIRSHRITPSTLFNFDSSKLKEHRVSLLNYLIGCVIVVYFFSIFIPTNELDLELKPPILQLFSLLFIAIMVPIFEEMIFRGYLYSAMIPSFKRERERLVVNAMLFACAHVFMASFLSGAEVPFYIFVLGYLLAKLYEESRSVIPCIVLHSLNNTLVFFIEFIRI